jgi:hypothetical protein
MRAIPPVVGVTPPLLTPGSIEGPRHFFALCRGPVPLESVDLRAPVHVPFSCPTCKDHGENQVVVVSFAPSLVGVVGRGYVDLHSEVEELFNEGVLERKAFGYLELPVLHEDQRGGKVLRSPGLIVYSSELRSTYM